jgi:hypothetical protein
MIGGRGFRGMHWRLRTKKEPRYEMRLESIFVLKYPAQDILDLSVDKVFGKH